MQVTVTNCLLFVFLVSAIGCTYPLTILNEDEFQPSPCVPISLPVSLGYVPIGDRLCDGVPNRIGERAFEYGVSRVRPVYGPGEDIDCVIRLSRTTDYRSSGVNFLITFPGFLIFAHAAFGYRYYVNIVTDSRLQDGTGKYLGTATIETPYEIAYTSYARGSSSAAWGWCGFLLFPPLWIGSIVKGIVYAVRYDREATPDFERAAEPSYTSFVASKVMEQVSRQRQASSGDPTDLHFAMERVVIQEGSAEDLKAGPGPRDFVVEVMAVRDGVLVPERRSALELSEEAFELFERIGSGELKPNAVDIQSLTRSLGVGDLAAVSPEMPCIGMYVVKDDKLACVFTQASSDPKVAMK